MGDVVHLVPMKKDSSHGHCPSCGTCIPTDFDILVHKTEVEAAKIVRGVCFSCPGCGKAMVAERTGTVSRETSA
jgi:predicted RNA-binding Zn-ribbon protein involved in translation (DUF1610 family)